MKIDRFSADRLLTASLRAMPAGIKISRILASGIQAVDPSEAIHNHVSFSDPLLKIDKLVLDVREFRQILVIGAGKAGAPMVQAISSILRDYLTKGAVIVKRGFAVLPSYPAEQSVITIYEASHPVPDMDCLMASHEVLKILEDCQADDLIICLISGGGSALLTLPAPGLSLKDIQDTTSALLSCGADISEFNTIRKHLDIVKGGGLARQAYPARLVSLILSDVVGDQLEIIASGPTVPDPSTYDEAYQVLERYHLTERIPDNIIQHLRMGMEGKIPENPKPGDGIFDKVDNFLIGGNRQAAISATKQAEAEGYNTLMLTTYLHGEARQMGRFLASIAKEVSLHDHPIPKPACIIAGGETTVTVIGGGVGGRNQELALSSAMEIAGLPDITIAALATDGNDGPTDAGGAIATGETISRALNLNLDARKYLDRNDSYHFFQALGDLLKPGATMTNANDLIAIFVGSNF